MPEEKKRYFSFLICESDREVIKQASKLKKLRPSVFVRSQILLISDAVIKANN